MNDENIKEILKGIGAEQVPADVQKLAQLTSSNFSESLTQQQRKPRQPVLLEYITRSRLPKLAAAAVIVIAVLVGLSVTNRESVAWASVVERVEKIMTVAFQMNVTMKGMPGVPEGETVETRNEAKFAYERGFVVDGITRVRGRDIANRTHVLFDENSAVVVMPGEKKYARIELTADLLEKMKEDNGDPRELLKKTMEYDNTKLGRDTINGIEVEGIEVTDPAMMLGMLDTIVVQLWCDVKTDLPVLMTMKGSANNGAVKFDMTMSDFDWEAEIDPSELAPEIPSDYELYIETGAGGGKDGKELIETGIALSNRRFDWDMLFYIELCVSLHGIVLIIP